MVAIYSWEVIRGTCSSGTAGDQARHWFPRTNAAPAGTEGATSLVRLIKAVTSARDGEESEESEEAEEAATLGEVAAVDEGDHHQADAAADEEGERIADVVPATDAEDAGEDAEPTDVG